MEAYSRLLFSLLMPPLKIVYFYTSCQPNWSLVSDAVFGGQEVVHMAITLINKTRLGTQPKVFQDSMYMEPSVNCAVLPMLSIIFFTPCMVFFVMSCLLRFYIIVARPANPHQETLTKPTQIIGLNLMGILVSFLYVGWILSITLLRQNQGPFTQACEAPYVKTDVVPWKKPIYAYSLIVLNTIALTLSITIVFKVKKSTTRSSSDSEHVKLIVYTLSHTVGFVFMLITTTLAKNVNSTNMTKVIINICHCQKV